MILSFELLDSVDFLLSFLDYFVLFELLLKLLNNLLIVSFVLGLGEVISGLIELTLKAFDLELLVVKVE